MLTQEQQRVGAAVLQALQEVQLTEGRLFVVVNGFSGIGKSFTLRYYAKEIEERGGIISGEGEWGRFFGRGGSEDFSRHIVTTASPLTIGRIKVDLDKINMKPIVQRGYTRPEILDFVENTGRKPANIPLSDVADLAAGMPGLALQLCLPGVTRETAITIAATYFIRNAPNIEAFSNDPSIQQTYLQMPLPRVLRQAIPVVTAQIYGKDEYIYRGLYHLLSKQVQEFPNEVAPFFISPKSVDIYNSMSGQYDIWSKETRDSFYEFYQDAGYHGSGDQRIKIIVPMIDPQNFRVLQQSFGFDGEQWGLQDAPRFRLFRASDYKVSFISRDQNGNERANWYHKHNYNWEPTKRRIPPELAGTCSLTVDSFEHTVGGQDRTNPFKVGWAVESWLQQNGVFYIVENGVIDKKYTYRPDIRDIELD